MKERVTKETIIRTIIAAVTMINFLLTTFEKNPIPFSESELYTYLSAVAAVASELWVWWKNNSFTRPAIEGDKYKEALKNGTIN